MRGRGSPRFFRGAAVMWLVGLAALVYLVIDWRERRRGNRWW